LAACCRPFSQTNTGLPSVDRGRGFGDYATHPIAVSGWIARR